MKSLLIILIALIAPVWVHGQTPLQEMVKAEQAFSKMAEETNTRDAFMAYIADDGLLFRDGAVNGKKWMLEHPVPPTDKKPSLAWQPSFAGMSASGDMGFTTGPWEFKDNFDDLKPSGYGHFVTVWKKQPDGSWKWVVDLGITHPQSGGPQKLWHPPAGKTTTRAVPNVDVATAVKELLDRDRAFASDLTEHGLTKAFTKFAAPDVRLYRSGRLPVLGRDASAAVLNSTKGQFTSKPINGDVARAGDLGYTHGTYELMGDANKVIERGSYVRIWKKQAGVWRVVLDVTNVHTK